jgi:uncharacterized protein (TIGR03437 family)
VLAQRGGAAASAASDAAARTRVESAQALVRNEISARGIRVTGSVTHVLNAVFVAAGPADVADLQKISGVLAVVPLGRRHRLLNDATQLMDAPQAWNLLGGLNNGGAGIKIGILDTGIDQTHPMMQDSSLSIPAGFPKCDAAAWSCSQFTNSKVIVARSYVAMDAAGYTPNPAASSQPDDYTPRDRDGHGTAVATVAAGNTATGTVTITGMAPKAWVGNYKIAGSPLVNDSAGDDAMISALDDAVNDGMDVITTSFGGSATTGPLDTGAACDQAPGTQCDPLAWAYETAAQAGHVILVAAGNEGEGGIYGTATLSPTYNTISTPATAPSVIAVGGVSNTHSFNPGVKVTGPNVPGNLNLITANYTDAASYDAFSGALIDLTQIGASDDYGCSALPLFSLNGEIALIERGGGQSCTFVAKMTNAVNAGAVGVIFWDNVSEPVSQISPSGLDSFTEQQAVIISQSDGQNLKAFIDSNPGYTVTIDPAAIEVPLGGSPVLVGYSSFGPDLGTNGIKPDVLGVAAGSANGDYIYMGAQNFDPLGDLYSSTRFIAAAGTSFATPLVAGIAAMVKQAHPSYSGQQIKSAIVNSASTSITADDSGNPVNVLETGAGLALADAALQTNVTIVPSTVSFGSLAAGASASGNVTLAFTNTGSSAVSLTLNVAPAASASGTTVSVNPASFSLGAGATQNVTVALSGTIATGGLYYGNINIRGGAVPMHVPYMFISPLGTSNGVNLDPILGDGDTAVVGQPIPDGSAAFQLTDSNGAPLTGVAVTFRVMTGSVPMTLSDVSTTTDRYGYAYADVTAGTQTGSYDIRATGGGQRYDFQGTVIAQPTITVSNGVVGVANAAAANVGSPVAPGSFVAIYGSNFATSPAEFYTPQFLPLSLNNITVSFDAPATGSLPAISVPGYLSYVSPGQVNVVVPWELEGYSSAQVKVTANEWDYGSLVTVQLSNYAPAFFENTPGNAAALDTNYQLINTSHPAVRGQIISLYVNGLGPVNNQPASGFPASLTTANQTTTQTPVVMIGGQSAQVVYSGLAPGYAGLYQVNVVVPTSISTGTQPITIAIGGATSKASGVAIQ